MTDQISRVSHRYKPQRNCQPSLPHRTPATCFDTFCPTLIAYFWNFRFILTPFAGLPVLGRNSLASASFQPTKPHFQPWGEERVALTTIDLPWLRLIPYT
ncbi:hypothetical protein RRG08_031272 [Elysia crispata]|uniref:Uncharacterized protein n=1 Tax=Elysia crispata TaxID=231223 RepID=A0AAE1AK02_9GAST|nr:hypothetical protein RRG08_031272 [Elysia crispata]